MAVVFQQSLFQPTGTVPFETSYHLVKAPSVQDGEFASPHVFLRDLDFQQKNCELLATFQRRILRSILVLLQDIS